jgi:hypothetical protein
MTLENGCNMTQTNFNLSQDLLKELFEYCDGNLFWKVNRGKARKGQLAGILGNTGYWKIRLYKRLYQAHRLIFLMQKGYLPVELDHIDGNKLNNRIDNLREATRSQNELNKGMKKNNTSGVKNVFWSKEFNKWKVQMSVDGKKRHVGYFEDLEVAKEIAINFRKQNHGEFANHGLKQVLL